MSRRIRRGRRGIDLPLKTPPAATDRLIGHAPSGAMFQATLAALTDAILGNITAAQINELLKAEVRIIVTSDAVVTNVPGRLPITASVVSPGNIALTCPVGWVWQGATATAATASPARTAMISPTDFGTRTLGVRTAQTSTGNAIASWFTLVGSLRPA